MRRLLTLGAAVQLTLGFLWLSSGLAGAAFSATNADATVLTPFSAAQRSHWAFQVPKDPPVPFVRNARWLRTPVDAFILSALQREGMEPAPRADRHTLIRRVTFDLIGLPPTMEEIRDFVSDTHADAWERVVDRLLASPHYGERWARFWLDAARYSDTKGYVYAEREESRFVQASLYRDWVIQALNEDLPYNEFLRLQIAADQYETPRANLAALGFITLGRRFLGVTHDIIDDRIDTVMRSTQALTVSCARCHDHKFDPIPTRDYYSLYGVFDACYEQLTPVKPELEKDPKCVAFLNGLHEREEKLQQAFERRRSSAAETFRKKVGEYLRAVLEVEKLPTEEFYEIRDEEELNPVIVRQWHAYLERRARLFDPIFAPWFVLSRLPSESYVTQARQAWSELDRLHGAELNSLVRHAFQSQTPTNLQETVQIYATLLKDVKGKMGEPVNSDAAVVALREVLWGADSPARVPSGSVVELEWFFGEGGRVELAGLQKSIDSYLVEAPMPVPYAVALRDRTDPKPSRVFKRGNPASKGEEVPRRFLEILSSSPRLPFIHGSGRRELAEAITSPKNPLTARVWVNRVWMHHFGAGLVRTPSDFGLRSEAPTHPELLDWLAVRFMEKGWSTKALHRLLLNSAVYQQQALSEGQGMRKDPENRWLGSASRRRLDFEAFRDSLLQVSGELDPTMGGKATPLFQEPFTHRRSIYGFIDRQFVPGVMRLFDFANPDAHTPRRAETSVPQQSLFLMNHPFTLDRARALGAQMRGLPRDQDGVLALYQHVLRRRPNAGEQSQAMAFLRQAREEHAPLSAVAREFVGPTDVRRGVDEWTQLSQVLLLSNEFIFVD